MSTQSQIRGPIRYVKRSRSTLQIKRNKAWQRCCNFWTYSMSIQQHADWITFAKHPDTGFMSFMRYNSYRVFNDLDIDPAPPRD